MAAKKMVSAGLNSVTGRLFPETRELLDEEEEMTGELTITNTEIASSLSLQMLLYFNVQYSLFWGLITLSLMVFSENYLEVNTAYRVLSPLLLSVWFMVEPLRLFFGYVGNLQEKVFAPGVAGVMCSSSLSLSLSLSSPLSLPSLSFVIPS